MSVTDLDLKRLEEKLDAVLQRIEQLAAESGPRAFTIKEAARRLSISETSLKARIRTQEIPSIMIGRSRRVPASAIERLLAPATPPVRQLRARKQPVDWKSQGDEIRRRAKAQR